MTGERLSEQGNAIVDLATRHRLLTLSLLQLFCPEADYDALRMLVTRLVEAGWLRKFPMGNRENYFALGSTALRALGAAGIRQHRVFRGFGAHGLIQHLGLGALCARRGLIRLLEQEFVGYFGAYTRPGLPVQNYLIPADSLNPMLYWGLVDHASSARRFPDKVGKVFASRFVLPDFREKILAGQFVVAIVTGTNAKANLIEEAFAENGSTYARTIVVVVPELEPLLFL